MKIDIKNLKKNFMFFVFSGATLVFITLFSMLFGSSTNELDKEDLNNNSVNIGSLVISEVMSSNNGVVIDEEGNLYDYVELYNGGTDDINLKNYGLSDEGEGVKWTFPDVTIKSKEYLVVKLNGSAKGGMSANFKLKSTGGEIVALFKPNGKVVDAVETVSIDSNNVMARNAEGKWVVYADPTPGYANTLDGHKAFIDSLVSKEESSIVINEVLPTNKGNFKNKNGEYSGYIEIKNIGDKTVDISNYSLSDSESVSFKWQFPSMSLSSGEVVVVYTSGLSKKDGELNTSFKLNSKNGTAVLADNKGKVIDKVKYENLANGLAYIRQDKLMLPGSSISPGYDNTVDGIKDFQKKYLSVSKDLYINEVMNNNYSHLAQNGGNYYDWIELYNNSKETIKLSDYCLTTNTDNICMYKLPNVELKSGSYYIVMASGDENLSNNKYKHAGFKLSEVEGLYLMKNTSVVDSLFINDVPNGYSFGRSGDYGTYYFSSPTPGKFNSNGTNAVSYMPYADVESGIYDKDSIKVSLSGSGKIYYTLDGSTPTTSSKVYSSPLTIKKTTVLRIMSKTDGMLKSEDLSYSYIMNEGHKVAVMSIAIDKSKLNKVDYNTSLNSTVLEECDVELLETDGSGFKIRAGLKLFGGSTRSYRKKSYELKFKKKYGDAELNYKVFDKLDSSVFNSLVLRTGSQDEFQYNDQRTVLKDVVATSVAGDHSTVDVQDYKSIILYINGDYRGIYWIREKVDETFVANHYNVQTTEEDTSILRIDGEVKTGTDKEYKKLISFVSNNDLNNEKNYEYVKSKIDITSLCDFWIGEIYMANYDILNTRYFSNPNVDGGKWKFIFYDADSGFFRTTNNSFTEYTNPSGMGFGYFPTTLLRNLMKSKHFKKDFLERLSYNLKNTWTYENVSGRIDEIINEYGKAEFKRNADRWDNSYSHWEKSISEMKKFAKNRNKYIVSQAKSYFGLSNAEVEKYFGGV